MNKYKIFEQYAKDEQQERFKLLKDPNLRAAAAADCFDPSWIVAKHPDTGMDVVYILSNKEQNKANPHVYFNPDFTADLRTTNDKSGKKANTRSWSCQRLFERTNTEASPIQKELLNLLVAKLGWKQHGDVKGTEIDQFDLTDVATDPDLKEGSPFYPLVSGLQQYLEDFRSAGRPFYMWKPKKATAAVVSSPEKQKEILKDYPGYNLCSPSESESGKYHVISIDEKEPSYFAKGTKLCKPWDLFSPQEKNQSIKNVLGRLSTQINKNGCRTLISLFIENFEDKMPMSDRDLSQIKPMVRTCNGKYNFPILKNKLEKMRMAKIKSVTGQIVDYSLFESTNNNVSKLVSEGLYKLKQQKNKKFSNESRHVKNRL